MACYHPVRAYRTETGTVSFVERQQGGSVATLELPCGQCIGCRLERARQWAIRCMHEASLSDSNAFVTLTYSELPERASLHYPHFQWFMKRLRRARKRRVRFFCAGEYGDQFGRPHYHALLFGCDFPDKVPMVQVVSKNRLWRSKELESLWRFGECAIGQVNFTTASYVARYCLKKVTGDLAANHYGDREPEFARMSLRPGLGEPWLCKYLGDIRDGEVVVNGVKQKVPRYYDKILGRLNPEQLELVQFERASAQRARAWDNTDERLAVREAVTAGSVQFKGSR